MVTCYSVMRKLWFARAAPALALFLPVGETVSRGLSSYRHYTRWHQTYRDTETTISLEAALTPAALAASTRT